MKRTQLSIVLAIVVSVFLLSFLIGRATALRDKEQESKRNEIYTGTIFIPKQEEPLVPAGAAVQKVEKDVISDENKPQIEKTEKKEENNQPPERMLFPCGQAVLNGYSQTAVYSKTMDDWRAHTGIDYAAKEGETVVSVWDGVVSKVYKDILWGYTIEIKHQGNIFSVYKNLKKKVSVKEGDKVKKGQAIAQVGSSAAVEKREEPHLHFELWTDGETINPESYIY
jgi:murein DD-endopeptidase MepM/ murein hydrolase activator NlpD